MPLIVAIVLLSALRFFEIGPFANLSWWWVAGLMVIAFLWFEFGEHLTGRDKRRAHEQLEKIRAERVRKTFEGSQRKKR